MTRFEDLPAIEAGARMPTAAHIHNQDAQRRTDAVEGSAKLLEAIQRYWRRRAG
jgi:hypothetical protein